MAHMIPYNQCLPKAPFGLHNSGSVCWLNSLLQALMSCPAFIHTTNIKFDTTTSSTILQTLTKAIMSSHNAALSTYGQQCPDEFLHILIDILGHVNSTVESIFHHRYKNTSFCQGCRMISYTNIDEPSNIVVNLHISEDMSALNYRSADWLAAYIKCHTELVDDVHCDNCDRRCRSTISYKLCRLSSIIVIRILNNNTKLTAIPQDLCYPTILSFTDKLNRQLKYKIVSTVNHFGGQHRHNDANRISFSSSGHYTATVVRDDKFIECNDSSVRYLSDVVGDTFANSNAVMLFYHLVQ